MENDKVGLGIDVVEIARIETILARTPRFRSIFTEEEQRYCDAKLHPAAHYAARFAAREAVVKALGSGFSCGVTPRDIEVKVSSAGRPYVVLSGKAQARAAQLGVRSLPISLTYRKVEAVACAMAITEDALKASLERKDPLDELAKQFKETRSMLDDL